MSGMPQVKFDHYKARRRGVFRGGALFFHSNIVCPTDKIVDRDVKIVGEQP